MKIFNYFLPVFIAMFFCVCIVSCGEDYSSPLKGQTVADQIFETGTNSKTITIGIDDLSKCTVTTNANWCSVTIQSSSVIISVQPNDTYGERQANVTITDPKDNTTLIFNVIQKQNDAILVDGSTFTIPEEGGDVNINVQSNVSYTVDVPADASWLTKKISTRGLANSTIVLTAPKNNSGDEREAIVKLTDPTSGTTSQFTVKQELTPVLTIDIDRYTVYESGGEIEIAVSSNTDIISDLDNLDDWVTNGGRIKEDGFCFTQIVKIAPLPEDKSRRSADIAFSDALGKWDIIKSVIIKQIRSLSIQDKDVEIYIGEDYSLNLVNNIGGSVKWTSSDTSVATVNSSGKVTGIGKGSATITVTSSDGKYSDKIIVKIKDIQSDISAFCNTGMIIGQGAIKYTISCFIKNNSKHDIELKNCSVYRNGSFIDSKSFSDVLSPGFFDGVKISSSMNITTMPHTFVWEYVFNGKTYKLECSYQP